MAREKSFSASEYDSETTLLIKRATIQITNALSDFREHYVLVGGMAPIFLIDQKSVPYEQQHIGSRDVDVSLDLVLSPDGHFEKLANRLVNAGFGHDKAKDGPFLHYAWRHSQLEKAVVEFLIDKEHAPNDSDKTMKLSENLSAISLPSIRLAVRDKELIQVTEDDLCGNSVESEFYVCGPGAFLVMKAYAFRTRVSGKDAYDIYYIAQNWGADYKDISNRILPLLDDEYTKQGVNFLRNYFSGRNSLGPTTLAQFLLRADDASFRTDVSSAVMAIVNHLPID